MRASRLAFGLMLGLVIVLSSAFEPARAQAPTIAEAKAALQRAAKHYHGMRAVGGGYVYFYSLDTNIRWGEGKAGPNQVWVQPPGTPTVGMAYLSAYRATGEKYYLNCATDAANSLIYGQLKSGGWTNAIDFDPKGRTAAYRNGRGKGKNNSSFDDGQSQAATRFLIQADHAHRHRNPKIREAVQVALEAILAAQFPNGGFPQVWTGPVGRQPVKSASFPQYDWRTEGRIKEYWNMYTLNDNVVGYLVETLIDAHRVYGDEDDRYLASLERIGDFLLLAQLPEPQRGWAQQYNYEMHPIWARKFEPPGIASDETQEAIATLIKLHRVTGKERFLLPIPDAIAWLRKSRLPDGRLARYYELKTNRPLYMSRSGDRYTLTYDDSRLPSHYGWKIESRIEALSKQYEAASAGKAQPTEPPPQSIREIIDSLDSEGRWVSKYGGEPMIGQAKMKRGERYLSSELFSRNLTALARFIANQ